MVQLIQILNTIPMVYGCVIGLLLNCYIGEEFSMIVTNFIVMLIVKH